MREDIATAGDTQYRLAAIEFTIAPRAGDAPDS